MWEVGSRIFEGGQAMAKKIDAVILKETKYIALWVVIFSVLMQAVFLMIGQWSYTVLLGNLLSAAVVVLNFFLMCLSVQRSLAKEPKDAKLSMQASQIYRYMLVVVVAVLGAVLPCFDMWATIIPLFFPRIAIALRPLFGGMDA